MAAIERKAARHAPHAFRASGTGCGLGVAMDTPARPPRLGAATREGLTRERRLDAWIMQLVAEQIERVYTDIGNCIAVDGHQTISSSAAALRFASGRGASKMRAFRNIGTGERMASRTIMLVKPA
jgi:hypothetical protein